MLTVCLLGPLEARTDGSPLRLTRPLEGALLARLALHPDTQVEANRLVDDLWADPARDQRRLHSTVYRLRRTLAGESPALEKQGGGYLLRIGRDQVDACRFEELVSQGRVRYRDGEPEEAAELLAAALALWRGLALADIGDPPFALTQRSRLAELRLTAFEERVRADLDCGRHAVIVGEVEAILADHPLREGLWRHLMLALYRCGRQADALGVYQRLRSRLAEELGIDPSPEVVALEEAILRQKPGLDWGAPPARRPSTESSSALPTSVPATWTGMPHLPDSLQGMSRSWALVGRGVERAFVASSMASGTSAGVVLVGGAGVGKTRLASEVVREAEQAGCSAAWVVATQSAASIPFGAFGHLVPQIPSASLSRLDLLQQIAGALVARAAGRRLVIGIDDAHLLDDASAALVHQLAFVAGAFVVVTLRAGKQVPDSIVALWKDGLAERLDVEALSEQEVAELLTRALGNQVDTPTMARLWGVSQGNALFLREFVLAGLEGGALVEAGGVWSWKGAMAISLRLQEIVAARLGTLEGDELALMEVVAYGEPVSVSVLETLLPPAVLETAERRGLVTVELSGRRTLIRPAHPLYGETMRARCPTMRARTIRRELATALEASGAHRADDLLRLATFRLESGEPGRADLLLKGAQRAFAIFDFRLSERLARAALEAGGGVAAKLAIAQMLVEQGRGAEAVKLLDDIDDLDLTEEKTAAASGLRAYALDQLGESAEAEQILLRTERQLHDSVLRDDLRSIRAWILFTRGQPQQAIAIFDTLERTGTNERARVRAAALAIAACAFVGRAEHAVALAERWIPRAAHVAAEFPVGRLVMRAGQSLALAIAGRLADAEGVASDVHREAVSRHFEDARATAAFVLGSVALVRGRADVALRRLREAAAAFRQPSRFNYVSAGLAWLAQALVLVGDLAGAEAALAEAETAMNPAVALLQPGLTLACAWLSLGQGDVSRACLLALQAADEAEGSGQYAIAVAALHDCARFGAPDVSRLDRLASLVDGPFAPARALHTAALAAKDGQGLDKAASHFAALGAYLLAAEAAADAAAVHGAEGQKAAMLASQARAQLHFKACKGIRAPLLPTLSRAVERCFSPPLKP